MKLFVQYFTEPARNIRIMNLITVAKFDPVIIYELSCLKETQSSKGYAII